MCRFVYLKRSIYLKINYTKQHVTLMAIITLTTDFGIKDHFAGAVKGALLSELSEVKVIDISHNISPFSILEAAYIIQNAFSSFPRKLNVTLHA